MEDNINAMSKGNKWRQKSKQLKKMSLPSQDDKSFDSGDGSDTVDEDMPKTFSLPSHVQIVDAITYSDEIKPYTSYAILVKQREAGECVFPNCLHCLAFYFRTLFIMQCSFTMY